VNPPREQTETFLRTFEGARGTYRLRYATVEEIALVAYHRAAMFRDMGEVDEAEASIIENTSLDHLAALMEAREYVGIFAEHESQVIGGGGIWLRPVLPRPLSLQGSMEAYVLNVYTEPGHRRSGVGRAIMEAILDWCRARRVARVTLHASLEGRPLYEGLGFEASNEMRLKLT